MAMNNSLTGSVVPRGSVGGNVKAAKKVYEKDYNNLFNKPQIEGNTLEGDMSFEELGAEPITSAELAAMWDN